MAAVQWWAAVKLKRTIAMSVSSYQDFQGSIMTSPYGLPWGWGSQAFQSPGPAGSLGCPIPTAWGDRARAARQPGEPSLARLPRLHGGKPGNPESLRQGSRAVRYRARSLENLGWTLRVFGSEAAPPYGLPWGWGPQGSSQASWPISLETMGPPAP